ncbi:Na+/H+ antiporter [Actinoalloteichus spitiensis]|uniref:Na+/H+ antiporter n=1 Tax=Actinoalloteichus spitiensis TaxID=252394 RepID=UPI00037140AB|nr:Na+/H+ antiporter [Actinoalloteichus spitiensis]
MGVLLLVIALMLGAVLLVGVGDRLRLPWPALMLLLGLAVAVIPGLPDRFDLDPDLILPLFLPPLLFAAAQRTSWAVFRTRWRSIVTLAIGLVVATTIAVAGTLALLLPGVAVASAIALGAMVAPPDPVAVESVASRVRIPRRLLAVLQSEGLFNDAAALVIFQTAIAASVRERDLDVGELALRFLLSAVAAVGVGLVVAWVARSFLTRITDSTGSAALTLVLPFAVYLGAEELGASGVIAVVVLALQLRSHSDVDEADERLTQRSFWNVVELLVTGLAFGLIGLDMRQVVTEAGSELGAMLAHAAVVCAVVVTLRLLWFLGAWLVLRRSRDASSAPRTTAEAVVMTWCGMRGLATLALALSVPSTTEDGSPFPGGAELTVIACAVLVVTLLFAGLTLPLVVRLLGVSSDASAEEAEERAVARRAHRAALRQITEWEERAELSDQVSALLRKRASRLEAKLCGDPEDEEQRERMAALRRKRDVLRDIEATVLAAARAEVLAARQEPGVDPAAADRVLRRLDLRTLLLD